MTTIDRPCPHVPGFRCPMMPGLECPEASGSFPPGPVAKAAYCRFEARRVGRHAPEPNERPAERYRK